MGQPMWGGRGIWEFHGQNREGAVAWRRESPTRHPLASPLPQIRPTGKIRYVFAKSYLWVQGGL